MMKLKEILGTAIRMEEEGYEFYKKAEGCTADRRGRGMFASLAEDEVRHRRILTGLLNNVPPDANDLDVPLPKERLRSVFAELAQGDVCDTVQPSADDIDALTIAMGKETESYRLYQQAAKDTGDAGARAMFERMAREEEQHYEILEQTRYYLTEFKNWTLWEEGGPIEGG